MNEARRKAIKVAQTKLDELSTYVENLRDEEQDYLDNMPEALANGDKGDAAQTVVDSLTEVVDYIAQAIEQLEDACC